MKKEKKYKRGDVREDGMVFVKLHKKFKCGEYWVTPQRFKEIKAKELKNRLRKRKAFEAIEKPLRMGDLRNDDDKVFLQYGVSYKNFECWISPESFKLNKKYHYEYKKTTKRKEHARKYVKARCDNDPLYRLAKNTRVMTIQAFKNKGYSRNTKTYKLIGCSFDDLKSHIESKFTKGMTWKNAGEWEVDHILPLSSARNRDELLKLCHYTNTQPLWMIDNRRKKDNYDPAELQAYLAA